jgi:small conductance mechanosensitive channel
VGDPFGIAAGSDSQRRNLREFGGICLAPRIATGLPAPDSGLLEHARHQDVLQETTSADPQRILSGLLVAGFEVAVILLVCGAAYAVSSLVLSGASRARSVAVVAWSQAARAKTRWLLLEACAVLIVAVLVLNGWLLWRGDDLRTFTSSQLAPLTPDLQRMIAIGLLKLFGAAAGLVLAARLLRRLIAVAETAINRWDQLSGNNESLTRFFNGLDKLVVNSAWIMLAVFACGWFGLPDVVSHTLLVALRIYLVVVIGVLVIRCTAFVVDTLDGLSQRAARKRGWMEYYHRLRPLVPTFRTCLQYVLGIAVASLVLYQIGVLRHLSAWGPRLIQAIGLFFLGRVLIEMGSLEIGHRMLPREGLSEVDRRRRATMVPLVRSTFRYAGYFGTAVMVLSVLGFNVMPFLAGAGILGLVIGFGAQSMIDDVVSGFFILFENTYLVGDSVEVGPAKGVVEAIEFRTTKIRDADGRLHIIRNGAIKPVINYSKDYTMAIVSVEVDYDADLRSVFATLQKAGERLRTDNPDVLADTSVDGITGFGTESMTVRTSTRVKPGRHDAVQAALRLLIKEQFDRQAIGGPRKTLVPQMRRERHDWPAAGQGA